MMKKVLALLVFLKSFLCADVNSTTGTIHFDVSDDGQSEMILNANGLSIGNTQSVHQLDISGNALVSMNLFLDGELKSLSSSNLNLAGNVVVNELSESVLFNVKGESEPNLFYIDSPNDRVGINTDSPESLFHIAGDLRLGVSGQAGSIRMSDVSGNPLLQLVGDRSVASQFSIVNNWGNASNSGVMIGTTRDDGIALQVNSDVNLSNGLPSSNGTQRMVVLGSGEVGVGITPSANLDISGNVRVSDHILPATTSVDLGTSASPFRDIYSQNTLTISDLRKKTNIETIPYGLEEVMKLKPVAYHWKSREDEDKTLGLIAQEVEGVVKEVVKQGHDSEKSRSMSYTQLIPILIKGLQEQQELIVELTERINQLEADQ